MRKTTDWYEVGHNAWIFIPLPHEKDRFLKRLNIIPNVNSGAWGAYLIKSIATPTDVLLEHPVAYFNWYGQNQEITREFSGENNWLAISNQTGAAAKFTAALEFTDSLKGRYVVK